MMSALNRPKKLISCGWLSNGELLIRLKSLATSVKEY
jgi:hypothetical protein